MKLQWMIVVIFGLAMLIAGCQPAATETPEQLPEAQPIIEELATPDQGAYPAPTQPPASPNVLYPGPADGDEVEWHQVQAMILNGEVLRIVQDSSPQATVFLKDGRSLLFPTPGEQELDIFLDYCGDVCKDIVIEP